MGLGLFISLGKVADIDTSIAEAIMTLTSSLVGENFKENSRTISYLLNKPENEITIQDIIDAITF